MPVQANFSINRGVDGAVTIEMAPPVAIGGWDMLFQAQKRMGSQSGFYRASMNSGFVGVSGITINNSGAGVVTVTIPAPSTSGLDTGAYTYTLWRNTSGQSTVLSEGYMEVLL